MKVALVTSLPTGGPLEHTLVLSAGLVRAGATVSAVCVDEATATRFEATGAHPIVHPLSSAGDLAGGWSLRGLTSAADVVHAQDRRSGLWTRIWPRRRGQIRVYTVHGLPDPFLPQPVGSAGPADVRDRIAYRGLDPYLARRSDAIVVASHFLATELVQRLGYPSDRIEVVPNGVEPLPSSPSGDLIGTISVLEPVKGLDTFIAAARLIRDERPGARFAIFGDGSSRGGLEELAAREGVATAIEFRGHVPACDALAELRLYVLCSWLENCPMALLEAMGAGRPAVATKVGGVPEIAGAAVELVPPGDPGALAMAVLELLVEPAAAERGAAGRERVLANFTADRNAETLLALYRRLLGGQG